ncbi:MAG: glycosyltransferase [Clostridia bacterium]|nr:glycosyltransferase [Clostridia bacterium]MBR3255729.1 glycosyltransferase [Clostridia bacterium]
MEKKIKVSIIVPVYKVEKYLNRSMDSLINQTLDGVEIICINDGSPDNCLNILKEYKEKYPDKNIVIIDKQNEGVWKGRFDGIEKAKGEYIGFTDSDDYIALDYAEKLYKAAKDSDADISVCGFDRMDVDTGHVYSTEMTQFEGKVIDMDKNPEDIISINTALWNKLYKAEVLKNMKNLENPPRVFDDMMFLLLAYLNTKKISFIKDSLYYYMVRQDSIMATIKKEQIQATQNAMLKIKEIYENDENGKKLIPVIDSMAFLHFGISLMFRISADKTSNFKEELRKNKEYLNTNFPSWRKSKYLNVSYCIKHKCNTKVAIMKKIYVCGLFRPFMASYNFMINKLKIDIKW